MLNFSFSLPWFSMQFIFLSRKTALQKILSFHLILFKILFHVYNFHLLIYHWFRSVSHKRGLDYQQGHTRHFFPWWSMKWGSSHSSILPQFLLVYLPACDPASRLDHESTCRFPTGLSARRPLHFLGLSVLLCHPGTPPTITPHTPPHRVPAHLYLPSDSLHRIQGHTSSDTVSLLPLILEDNLYYLCRIPRTYCSIWWKSETWLQILSILQQTPKCATTVQHIGEEVLEVQKAALSFFKNHCVLKIRV